MMLLVLAALLRTQAPDDPAVLYREGLYEEVDQGDLEKAMEIYGRLLKGSADAALNARALYRRGSCLEKAGKKKEAEQVYRDLSERFSEQAEMAKLARGRLAALAAPLSGPAATLDTEIQQLVLDLGAADDAREKAIERLALIGDPALPELRRALGHKDRRLALGAARVLAALEQYENLYGVFMRSSDQRDLAVFGRMLKASEADRSRFYRDCGQVSSYGLSKIIAGADSTLQDPRLRKVVEDRLLSATVRELNDVGSVNWWTVSGPEHLPALLRRLASEGGELILEKVAWLLWTRPDRGGKFGVPPEVAAELRGLLKRGRIRSFEGWLELIVPYVTAEVALTEVIPAWLKSPDVPDAVNAVRTVRAFATDQNGDWIPGLAEYLLGVLDSPDYRGEVKQALCDAKFEGLALERPALTPKLLRFYVDQLRRRDKEEDRRGSASEVSERAHGFLVRHLPADAEGWEVVFEADLHFLGSMLSALEDRIRESERLRALYVQALLRALRDPSLNVRRRALRDFNAYGTDRERRELSGILAETPKELIPQLAGTMAVGFRPLGVEERAAALREIAPLFKSPEPRLRQALLLEFRAFSDSSMDSIMKEALADPALENRRLAYDYWCKRKSAEAVPLLIQGLKDPDDVIQAAAIQALGRSPSIDAVPAILEFLQSPNAVLRASAQAALKEIQQYYDEQELWRKWYEETKRRVSKEK